MAARTVEQARKGRRRALWSSAGLLLAALLVSLVFMAREGGGLVSLLNVLPGRQRFDSTLWKESQDNWKDPVRLRMVDDLLRRHPLIDLERGEVQELLGPPLSPQPFGNGLLSEARFTPDPFIYHLGPDHLHLDSMWLAVEFDVRGRVTGARVVSD